MLKKIIIAIIAITALGLGFYFTAPQFRAKETKLPFDSETISNNIIKELASNEFSSDPRCPLLVERLGNIYSTMACQDSKYSSSEAQEQINNIMANYQVEAVNDWTVNGNYVARIYVANKTQTAETINLVVSDKIIFIGY